ncbi:hypothetical protein HDU67_010364 [Dinochytrium kinnereticum]|nr:hypothetical protein HDU67_010364 [Dinochytrium kinnereticum]
MVPDLASTQASSALLAEFNAEIVTGDDDFTQQIPFGKIVYGSGEWYPTLQKTLYILGKMYKALPHAIFEDLSQEAISFCLKSLLTATDVIEKKTTKIDGQFFLIKNLLMLREQIAPFDSNFVRREDLLDFSNFSDAFAAVYKSGWDISKLASIGLGLVSTGSVVPRVIETFNDARRAVSDELRKVCEAMILETAKGAMDPVASFMIKATAFKLKQEREAKQAHSGALERLGLQSFASPQNCVAVSEALRVSVPEKVSLSVKKMVDYIGDPKTEDVLIYHIKTNIVETYTVFYNTVTGEHDYRVLQGFMSIKEISSVFPKKEYQHFHDGDRQKQTNMIRLTQRNLLYIAIAIIGTILLSSFLLVSDLKDPVFTEVKDDLVSSGAFKDLRVVVSISTFGARTNRIEGTVDSIYRQSRRPEVLYLHIPKEVKRIEVGEVLVPLVRELEKKYDGWLKVTRPEDYGPSTKLLGSLLLEKDPDTIIVTLDDDEVYHTDLVLALVEAAERNRNVAPCFICEKWPWWSFKPMYAPKGICHGWGNAFAGIAYRVKFFDEKVFDYSNIPDGCRLHDDVYLSGFMRSKGYRPMVIDPGFQPITQGLSHTNLSIHMVKNTESGYRDPCVRFFNYLS